MSVAGIPLSMLARQALMLGGAFGSRYTHAWLVWEPGTRVTPAPLDPATVSTVVPVSSNSRIPTYEDATCFPLVPRMGGLPTRVGRSTECDLCLDDLTVSREHFDLWPEGDDWFISIPEQSHATTLVRNNSLQPQERMRLIDGCTIVAGGVTLTFFARGRLTPRVLAAVERLPKSG